MLEDIAVLTGGTVISEELGFKLNETTLDQLGRAKTVKVEKENTVIVDGAGEKIQLEERINQIKAQITSSTSDFESTSLRERLAKLTGGVAVIKVGAATQTEMKERKERIEDALASTRAAAEEGIIAGGGAAYIHATKELDKLLNTLEGDERTGAQLILKSLEAPLRQIVTNAGLEPSVIVNKIKESKEDIGFDATTEKFINMVDGGIIDPAKVTRSALQNANSVATMLLTTESAVANISEEESDFQTPPMGMM